MNNTEKNNIKKGWPVYAVFVFLIVVLGYVIYVQTQRDRAPEPIEESVEQELVETVAQPVDPNYQEIDDQPAQQNQAEPEQKQVLAVTKSEANEVEIKPSLAEIIRNRKTWDAIEPMLYGQKAPDFTVKTLDGNDVSLGEYKGKNVLVVFWATWCPYCVKEIPILNRLQSEMDDKLQILGISNESANVVRNFVQNREINYDMALSSGGFNQMGSTYIMVTRYGLPTAMLVDPQGSIKVIYVGVASYEEIKGMIEAEKS